MNNSLSSRQFEVKYAGIAIEYGSFSLLIESLNQQPVLVMPLERSLLHGSVAIYQWMIHVTTRTDANSLVAYTTFRTAEVKETVLGQTLIFPSQTGLTHPKERAPQFQQQLLACVTDLLKRSAHVSQVIVPARYRLPDEWAWSARCTDERVMWRDGAWVLLEG